MPAYVIELAEGARHLPGGFDRLVVFASNVTDARTTAAGAFDGDSDETWLTGATVTQITTETDLTDVGGGWSMYCKITGAAAQTVDPIIVEVDGLTRNQVTGVLGRDRLHLESAAINSAGTGYTAGDIVTVSGGTFTRAATVEVVAVSTGVPTLIGLADPGEYTELPDLTAAVTTGGTGTGLTVDLTQAVNGGLKALAAQLVTALNSQADISGAVADFSNDVLTFASAGDGLGDATVTYEIRRNGVDQDFLVQTGTLVHEGAAGAALTIDPEFDTSPGAVFPLKSR